MSGEHDVRELDLITGSSSSRLGSAPRRPARQAPTGRTIALSLVGAAAAACVTGAILGLVRPAPDAAVGAQTSETLPSVSAPATSAPGTVVAAAEKSPAASPSAAASTPAPDSAELVPEPWKAGLDFAVITEVRQRDGLVQLKVDRLTFLTGSDARKYYREHHDQPPKDYAIANQSKKIFTYTLVPGAPLFGGRTLAGSPQQDIAIGPDQLVARASEALAAKQSIYVWLRHQDGGKGWTTYLAEQTLP